MNIFPPVLALFAAGLVAGCGSPAGPRARTPDDETGKLAGMARKLMEMDAPDKAARVYADALNRARARNDDAVIGMLAYNLAGCRYALGDSAGARAALREAIPALRHAGRSTADARALDQRAALNLDAPQAVAAACRAALDDAEFRGAPAARAQVRLVQAAACLRAGNDQAAEDALTAARREIRRPPPGLRARLDGVEGDLGMARKQPADAARAYDRAAENYRAANLPAPLAQTLQSAAEAWAAAGDAAAAADRWYRAARAQVGAGKPEAARAAARRAMGLAKALDTSPDWLPALDELSAELETPRPAAGTPQP